MQIFNEKIKLLTWLSLVLTMGFLATSLAGFVVSRDLIRQGISAQELPLTGDNIYSELQKDLLRPIFISSLMASDTFMRDWMIEGERDKDQIARYLREVKERYGAVTSFLVSEGTRTYYHAGGLLKQVREDEPRDAWYFRVRQLPEPYEINVDPDMANRDTMTIFINYRVLDYQGRFLGATGVGLTIDAVRRIIETYQERFQRRIFLVDHQGELTLTGQSMRDLRGNIRQMPGLADIASDILLVNQEPQQLVYERAGNRVLVNSRYIPELGWHLVVEQEEYAAISPLKRVLVINLLVSAAITLLVLFLAWYTVNRFQGRLEQMAARDKLSGLYNRQALELVFGQLTREMDRQRFSLSLIMFDIDLFKGVNDLHGHVFGDMVIRQVAGLTQACLRKSDVLARWGGEEFLVLLRDCRLEDAVEVAEKIRLAISGHQFSQGQASAHVTVSLGVTAYAPGESLDGVLRRADAALYRAKGLGRDQSHFVEP